MHEVKSIQDLLNQISRDEILLPEFQRGYVWNRDQVRGLMQSLYRKHPTGHLLIWRTYKPSLVRGGEAARDGHSLLLLDGQQRLTTLYVLFKGEAPPFYEGESLFFDLHFNMQTEEFRFWLKSHMENNPAWIGVHEFLQEGLTALLERLEELDEQRQTVIQQNLARLGRLESIRDYTYTVDQVSGDNYSIEEVVDIFNRVNSRGTPLTRADLALAHVCSLWPEARAELRAFKAKMAERGFDVDLNFLVRCLAAVATGSVLLEGSFLKTPAASLQGAWQKMQPAFEHLVSVLRREAFISGLDDLSTNFVLIPATIYLACQGGQFPTDAVRRRFIRWIFLAGLWARYSGATDTKLQQDVALVTGHDLDPTHELEGHSAGARAGHVAGRGPGACPYRLLGRPPDPHRGAASRRPRLVHRRPHLRPGDRKKPPRGASLHLSQEGTQEGGVQRRDADQRGGQPGPARTTGAQGAGRGVARGVSAGGQRVPARRPEGAVGAHGPGALAAGAVPRFSVCPPAPLGRGDEQVHRPVAPTGRGRPRAARARTDRRGRERDPGVQGKPALGPPGGAGQQDARRRGRQDARRIPECDGRHASHRRRRPWCAGRARRRLREPPPEGPGRIRAAAAGRAGSRSRRVGVLFVPDHQLPRDRRTGHLPGHCRTERPSDLRRAPERSHLLLARRQRYPGTARQRGSAVRRTALGEDSVIPRECKRLAEVDFPIAVVSKHAAREKSIRHGHPSTLHLWWARRPLASSRAVLLALLLPDPCDSRCPEAFKRQAREILSAVRQPPRSDEELRKALLWFIGAFANWDMAAHSSYLQVGRSLVQAAHDEEAPLVVDPFAGGGSIPLEALRLGCEAFASDLNPVACLILKVMLEDIPRHGPELADELRKAGARIKEAVEKELADLYPADSDGATPIAYLWARTVRCEAPNCGAEIPLMRSCWLCKKTRRKRALRHRVQRPAGEIPRVEFEVFEPRAGREVPNGTVTRARATCLCCGAVLPPERVRAQLAAERGGADVVFDEEGRRVDGARMTAVVTLRPGASGRHYRLPTQADYAAVRKAQDRIARVLADWERGGRQGLCPVPDEPTPAGGGSGAGRAFSVQRYGMLQWGDLFTARQKAALVGIGRTVRVGDFDQATRDVLAMVGSRCSDYDSAGVGWAPTGEFVKGTFARQALPIVWDFAEPVLCRDSSGSFEGALDWVGRVVNSWPGSGVSQCQQADAAEHPLPDETAGVWFTDPPYYDAIPYSDLSDFFLVWLKRTLPTHSLLRDPFDPDNSLSPKTAEAVQDETKQVDGRPKDRAWFEETMSRAFAEGRRVLREDGVGSVVFAHKTTEGWEALLSGMIRGGWTITASWPIATERPSRLRSQDSAALATSVHLVCRRRPEDAPVGDWADVLRELPVRVAAWMERLQGEGIRGADLVFACIGPALEIFSRYRAVESAEGRPVGLSEYLEKVWEVVGRTALETVLGAAEAKARNGLAGALEEDARLTALFLWTLQATTGDGTREVDAQDADAPGDDGDEDVENASTGKAKGFSLVFDVVRRFAQPLGIDLEKWERRTIETKKGVVRLLPVAERATQLFGEHGSQAVAAWLEQKTEAGTDPLQGLLFLDRQEGGAVAVRERPRRYGDVDGAADRSAAGPGATTLDRVHTGMLLQAGGRTNALRALLQAEQERGADFLRLANALSALYPRGSDEKRLLDAMLLAVPR